MFATMYGVPKYSKAQSACATGLSSCYRIEQVLRVLWTYLTSPSSVKHQPINGAQLISLHSSMLGFLAVGFALLSVCPTLHMPEH